jgi:heme A synthase
MNGHVLPPESFIIDPWYLNFFNNMALVQFDHRLGAWLLAFWCPWFWWKISAGRGVDGAPGGNAVAGGGVRPDRLGIATLLLAVPVGLGAAHQGGAMVVLGLLLWLNHELRVAHSTRRPYQMMASAGPSRFAKIRATARLLTALSLLVVSLSAYLRLDGAGLGCADWPACYGGCWRCEPAGPALRAVRLLHRALASTVAAARLCSRLAVLAAAGAAAVALPATLLLLLMLALSALGIWSSDPRLTLVNLPEHHGRPRAGHLLLASGAGQRAAVDAAARPAPTVLLRLGAACLSLTVILGALIGASYMALSVRQPFPIVTAAGGPRRQAGRRCRRLPCCRRHPPPGDPGGVNLHLLHRYSAVRRCCCWARRECRRCPVTSIGGGRPGAAAVLLAATVALGILTVLRASACGWRSAITSHAQRYCWRRWQAAARRVKTGDAPQSDADIGGWRQKGVAKVQASAAVVGVPPASGWLDRERRAAAAGR